MLNIIPEAFFDEIIKLGDYVKTRLEAINYKREAKDTSMIVYGVKKMRDHIRELERLIPVKKRIKRPRIDKMEKILAVVKAAKNLIGKENIGKTMDTSVDFSGSAISAVFHGSSLYNLHTALEDLENHS